MTAQNILSLIENGERESRTLDFKSEPYGPKDDGKRELLKDVTAMANTQGGTILIGVEDTDAEATGLSKLKVEDFDQLRGRYAQLLTSCVDPSLHGVDISLIEVDSESCVIAIKIPLSWARPHRVELGNQSYFFLRTSHGNDAMDTTDIRQAVLSTDQAGERMRRFRVERVSLIGSGEGPVPLTGRLRLVTHIIPGRGFPDREPVNLIGLYESAPNIFGDKWSMFQKVFTFDGLLGAWTRELDTPQRAYVQFFRNGVVEFVHSHELPSDRAAGPAKVTGVHLESHFVQSLTRFKPALHFLEVDADLFVGFSITGAAGVHLACGRYDLHTKPFSRDVLIFPEVQLETLPSDDSQARGLVELPLDVIWQSAGYVKSMAVDSNGKWLGEG